MMIQPHILTSQRKNGKKNKNTKNKLKSWNNHFIEKEYDVREYDLRVKISYKK